MSDYYCCVGCGRLLPKDEACPCGHVDEPQPQTSFYDLWEGDRRSTVDRRLNASTAAKDTPYGLAALRDECLEVSLTSEGARNERLNIAATRMGSLIGGGHLTYATAHTELTAAGLKSGLPQNEVDLVLRGDATGGLVAGQRSPRSVTEPVSAHALTAQTYADEYLTRSQLKNLPVAEPLIDAVLPRHSYGILRGRDHSFKTFIALDWALSLATGQPWLGQHVEKARVLYIAGEGAYGIDKRTDAWEAARGLTVDDETFLVRKSALSLFKPSAAFDHMLDLIESGEFGLVVVDTLRRVSGSADGNSSDMGTVVDNLDRIKRATGRGSVLVLAHTGKDDNDSRGFSGIEDDADVVWHAKRDEMHLELRCAKFKDGPDGHAFNLQARTEGESMVLEAAGEFSMIASESQIKLLDTLRGAFPDGASGAQLRDASELPKPTFYRVLADLIGDGHVVKSGTRQRPFYELNRSRESHEVSTEPQPTDLHESHQSHGVSPEPGGVSRVSPPLRVRHETTTNETRPNDVGVA
jgi:hypothetical protein